jgi:tyrosine-protein phosphatase SIW14
MSRALRAVLICGLFFIIVVMPYFAFRYKYTYQKRLRVVVPGRVYRMGQATAPGFRTTVHDLGIRAIVNLQDDFPDPDIDAGYWTLQTIKESELCRELGVKFVQISPDLISRRCIPQERPLAIEEFLAVMDDDSNYPVLFHCRAGLHRTGLMAAIYRMEYEGWTQAAAWRELRAHGFGEWVSTASNDYIRQYLLSYRPHLRRAADGTYILWSPRNGFPGMNGTDGTDENSSHSIRPLFPMRTITEPATDY